MHDKSMFIHPSKSRFDQLSCFHSYSNSIPNVVDRSVLGSKHSLGRSACKCDRRSLDLELIEEGVDEGHTIIDSSIPSSPDCRISERHSHVVFCFHHPTLQLTREVHIHIHTRTHTFAYSLLYSSSHCIIYCITFMSLSPTFTSVGCALTAVRAQHFSARACASRGREVEKILHRHRESDSPIHTIMDAWRMTCLTHTHTFYADLKGRA